MTRPTLMLLHGALHTGRQFDMLKSLLEADFDCHTFDFPGHGENALQSRKFGIETFVDSVIHVMSEANIASAHFFGYSMGGYVAMVLAQRAPERVKSIYTLGTKYLWTPEYAAQETRKLDAETIKLKVPAFAAELEQRHCKAYDDWTEVLQHTREMMYALGAENQVTLDQLSSIDQPVRIAQGDRDNTLTIEEGIAMYKILSNAQLQILPNTPHPFERVKMEELVLGIKSFCGRV